MRNIIFLLLIVIVAISAKTSKNVKPECEGEHINGEFHKKSVIMNGLDRPYQLAFYNKENKVFFSCNEGNDTTDTFGIAFVGKHDTVPKEIRGVKNGFAIAIDEHTHTAYFGGSEGIYADNLPKSDGIKHILKNYNVWDMFFHHHLYFIDYPKQRLHKYENHNATLQEHIHEKIYQFVIDGHNDVFITTKDGLLLIKNGTNDRISYKGPKKFRAIEVNHAGVAHFCGQNSIFIANKENHTLVEIATIKHIFGLTFDSSDHFIYSNSHEIIKLLPGHCEADKKN